MRLLILALVSVLGFVAFQQKPTKVTTKEPVLSGNMTAEKVMAGHPVILDVRSPFDFNLAHVPGAINVRWEDFSQQDPRYRGLLQTDLFALARRLSLIGIDLDSHVVVLGKGRQGQGEEGRVAWTLQVLGVRNVYTLVSSSYRAMNPKEDAAPVMNKPYWKPEVNESLTISAREFKAYALREIPPLTYSSKARSMSLGGMHQGALDEPIRPVFGMRFNDAKEKVVILDVRSPQEFSLHNLSQIKEVKSPVINIEWREFFDDKGWPNKAVEKSLTEKGISKDKIIMVIGNYGVESAAVTYALRAIGFQQSTNYAGGYEQWK